MTKNLKVLLVEDELLIAENVKEMLEDQGHKVVDICTTVTQAAASFSKHNPDLVLLDIKLQGKGSGIELSEMIRKYSSVPIIFVTANSDEKTFQMAIQTSPYGYLTKPVNEKDLTVAVALAVNRHSDAQLRLELESIANNADQFIQLRELTESLIHDVINPLMSAQRSLSVLKDAIEKNCEKVDLKLKFTMDLIVKFREATRGQQEFFELFDVKDGVHSALLIMNHSLKLNEIEVKLIGLDAKVHCQKIILTRILVNLIKNAAEAIDKFPNRWIEIKAEVVGQLTKIYITDSGDGLSKEAQDNLFVRFYTSKGPEKGNGIGLSSAKSAIKKMGGDLIYNAESKNTQFIISIPSVPN